MGRLKGSPGCCVLAAIALCLALTIVPASAAPEGLLTWGVHVTPAPTWFDPAEAPGLISFEFYWQPPVPAYDPARAKPRLVHDKAMFAPIRPLAFLNGVGSRVEESGLGLNAGHAYSAPYEDLRVRK